MNLRNFPLLITAIIFTVASCTSKSKPTEEIVDFDSLQVEVESDTISRMFSDTLKKAHEVREQKENLLVIEKKYGEQWGFCECVMANDSIDKAVKSLVDFETPAAEKLLERFEYVSTKCQAFLGMDNSRTPEQRAAHQKKVKNCLSNARNK